MPYRSRYNRVPTNKQLNKKIKKLTDTELKYKDNNYAVPNTSLRTGLPYFVNNPGEGTDERARIGDIIRATSLKLKIQFLRTLPANLKGENAVSCFVRIVVFWDKQVNGAVPNLIPASADQPGVLDTQTIIDPIVAPYNYPYMQERFTILMDKVLDLSYHGLQPAVYETVDPATDYWYPPKYAYFKKNIKLSRKCIYDGSGVVVDQIITNGLFVSMYAIQPYDETNPESLNAVLSTRFYFKDD